MHRMATMKRRVIYMSDDEWALAQTQASDRGMTVSAYVRLQAVTGIALTTGLREITIDIPAEPRRFNINDDEHH